MKVRATQVFVTEFEGRSYSFTTKRDYDVPDELGERFAGLGLLEPLEKRARRAESKPELKDEDK